VVRGVVLVSAVLASACGRYQFAPIGDASSDAPLGAFAASQPVSALLDPRNDDDPTATGDALELYFASERIGMAGGYADLYVSTRGSRDEPWGPPQNVAELNSADEDQSPGVSSDGLTMYFSSRRASPLGGTSSNIWMATRARRSDAWGTPTFVAELSTAMDEFEPQPDETGLLLVLYRDLGNGNRDVLESTRATGAEPWGTPVALANIDGAGDERSPCLRDAGRELWFSSDRDAGVAGVQDIFMARRATASDDFPAGTAASELNTSGGDDDPWISPDGHVLIFSSDRDGNPEIYETQR
jgi:hypothetical protein